MLSGSVTNSPMNSPSSSTRALDSAPPMPRSQSKPPSVLFTPPMEDNSAVGQAGGDPVVQDMQAMAQFDQVLQGISMRHPEAIDPLAQLQQSFRQLMVGITTMQQNPMGAMTPPSMGAPLPMASNPVPGMQQGVGL